MTFDLLRIRAIEAGDRSNGVQIMFDYVPQLQNEVERQVQSRTGRRIRQLSVQLDRERVILHGRAATYYLKQLAQHGVRDVLPQARLENAIEVDHN
jgi:hypothetical protein